VLSVLVEELKAYRALVDDRPYALMFGTRTGRPQNPTNVNRMLAGVVAEANKGLAKTDGELLPHLTPRSFRRTYASILNALGESPAYVKVKAQTRRESTNLALEVYAQMMGRRDGEPERLRALMEGSNWQRIGSSANVVVDLGDRQRRTA
jgi:integrase